MQKKPTQWTGLAKVLCLLLAVIFAASFAGCSPNTAAPVNTTAATSASSSAASNEASATMPSAAKTTDIDVYIDYTWYPTDKFEGIIPQTITEKTGVVFKPTRSADDKQLGLMIASGDLPEMIFTANNLTRLSDSNLCYSYNELIGKYAPDWKPDPTSIVNSKSYSADSNYYFLFSHAFTKAEWDAATCGVPMVSSLCYRADIAEKVGMPTASINSMDDLDTLLAKVKEQYPQMSLLTYHPVSRFQYWEIQMGVNLCNWNEVDGKYVHSIEYANYEQYLKKMNDYYRKGYINPDSFAYQQSDTENALTSGKSFAICAGTQGFAYTWSQMAQKVDPNANILEMKPLSDKAVYHLTGLGWSATFITKKCKNPDAAIKVMQYLFSPEGARLTMWGREGTEYTLGENGIPKFSQDWIDAQKDATLFNSKYNTQFYFGTTALIEGIGRTAFLGSEYQDVYNNIRSKIAIEPWFTLAAPKDPDSDEYVINSKLNDLMNSQEIKIIQSKDDAEFAANMQELKDNAKQIGIDKLTAYMNGKIPEAKAMYSK
jgi:putative aldouronate transport system substrate-binding protein